MLLINSANLYAESSGLVNENLLMDLPLPSGDWDVYQGQEKGSDLLETRWVSKKSDDMVQMFVMYKTPNGDVKKAKAVDNAIGRENCNKMFESEVISDKAQNGYQQLTWYTLCKTKGEFYSKAIHKSIAGHDSMYEFKRIFRSEPSVSEWETWLEYTSTIKVCDSRLPDQACPEGLERVK